MNLLLVLTGILWVVSAGHFLFFLYQGRVKHESIDLSEALATVIWICLSIITSGLYFLFYYFGDK